MTNSRLSGFRNLTVEQRRAKLAAERQASSPASSTCSARLRD
ncbi:hypothetical protein [Aeromicrobium sp. UC242_57]